MIRRQLSGAGFWVLGTTIGWVIGVFSGALISGLLLGAFQYVAIFYRLRRPLLGLPWPLASAVARVAGATAQGLFPKAHTVLEADLTPLVGWSAGWAVYGILSAVAFAILIV